MNGVFITFEGGEGTGKTTQVEMLAHHLRERGHEVITTREPGGTPLAERIRELVLDPSYRPDALTELLLLEAARHDHVQRILRPALARGAVVLCDRFSDSSTVYQGLVGGVAPETVEQLNRLATGGLEPDLTLVFELPPAVAQRRIAHRTAPVSRLDTAPGEFHRRVAEGFRRLAAMCPERIRIVSAAGEPEEVFRKVRSIVEEVLP